MLTYIYNKKVKHLHFSFQMQCHASPIYTLARNPSFFKNFLTVGDWNARIWSEDCKESSIIWTKYCNVELTDGCWSPTKCSLFYLSRMDGNVEAWDLLQQQSEPILTIKVPFPCHFLYFFVSVLFSF
jgi:dynein intermediate chain 2